jgi:arylsulfatase A-like enzyme
MKKTNRYKQLSIIVLSILPVLGIISFTNISLHEQAQQKQPNLIIIIADQWRGQALGFEKKEPVNTPVLDAFAKQSLVLEQMVSNYPVCSPARAMLMSGIYPMKNHVYSNVNSASAPSGIELPANMVCWSDVLKTNGYSNGYIGKWHLDSPHEPYVLTSNNDKKIAWNEWTPPNRRHGFDYWYAYGTYDVHNKPMYWDTHEARDSFHYVNQWGPEHEADKTLAFLKNENNVYRKNGEPFSLVVSMNPPHSEYETVPEKYYQLYKNIPLDSLLKDPNIPPAGTPMGDEYRKHIRYYYANITGVDEQIGRILNGVKNLHLDDNTIIVFMADHGNCLGKHDEVSKNNIYEESLRIPFIISWKGHIQPKLDKMFLGSIPDLYPTLLDLMGLKKNIPANIDGVSYADYFTGKSVKMPSEQFILGAIMSNSARKNSGFRGIRNTRYKLAYVRKKDKVEPYLFDMQNDPFELNNIYTNNPSIVQPMKTSLLQWLKKTGDPFVVE